MTITLTPHAEELLNQLTRIGGSPEQILEQALERLAEQQRTLTSSHGRTIAEAVDHIRTSRKGITLGGIKIKDLIIEGRKY